MLSHTVCCHLRVCAAIFSVAVLQDNEDLLVVLDVLVDAGVRRYARIQEVTKYHWFLTESLCCPEHLEQRWGHFHKGGAWTYST